MIAEYAPITVCMIQTGLVISWESPPSEELIAQLDAHPSLTLGERAGRWRSEALPGVAFVDVVHVNFDSDAHEPELPTPAQT